MSMPTAQSRIYISGPITGDPDYRRKFDDAENLLVECFPGCGVVNPTSNFGGDATLDRHVYFRTDFRQLVECSHILMLHGWEKSPGARAELIAAQEMGISVLQESHDGSPVRANPVVTTRVGWQPEETDAGPKSVCAEADGIVDGARRDDYGHPRDNLEQTARLWQEVLPVGRPLNGQDVSLMMILLKVSRMCHRPTRDNWVDICGYSKCGDMCSPGGSK